jgi:AmmeMemoRadiSam system protein B
VQLPITNRPTDPAWTPHLRQPAVDGVFYPEDPRRLRADLDAMLDAAKHVDLRPRALIAPHAGYAYSGPVAASAYVLLADLEPKPRRVVILGPAHTAPLQSLALPEAEAFATPLGVVAVDRAGADAAARFSQVTTSALAHEREHSLEVQLPFLQRILGDFTIVPLVVGHVGADEVAEVIDALWTAETLVVVSSDLSHDLNYASAKRIDTYTARRICALDFEHIEGNQACGAFPVRGLLRSVARRGGRIELLDLRNSADTSGDARRVVGYGAFAVVEGGRS